jgi:CRISPR/Cas system-associated endonuclease Cas3-HD
MKKIFRKIRKLAEPYLATRKNDLHTDISTHMAYALIKELGGVEGIIIPAVILHDVGWKTVPEELQPEAFGPGSTRPELNRRHEVEGARIAGEILKSVEYDKDKIREILEIIEGHDSRKEALSLNDRIVKDADKLWRFTREGVMIDTWRFQESRAQGLIRLDSNLEGWLFTDAAKRIARAELDQRRAESSTGNPA